MPAHRSSPKLELHDPRDIRALAHQARMAIIDALATGDELTATECVELTGLSASATAYHLKLLQRYDFAERAPARNDGRERPWRATSRGGTVDLDTSTPAGAAAVAAVGLAYFERSRTLAEEFIAGERDEPEEWQNVAALTNAVDLAKDLLRRPDDSDTAMATRVLHMATMFEAYLTGEEANGDS